MKKIIVIIFALFGCAAMYSNDFDNIENQDDTNLAASLHYLPDSVIYALDNKHFLIYSYGHHGIKWSIICKEGDSYHISMGTTRKEKQDPNAIIDTFALVNDYRDLFQWGLDTLPVLAKSMEAHYRDYYFFSYSTLDVFSSNQNLFASDDAIYYSGPDSASFNKKLNYLFYLMLWLSEPGIRQYLPGFEKY